MDIITSILEHFKSIEKTSQERELCSIDFSSLGMDIVNEIWDRGIDAHYEDEKLRLALDQYLTNYIIMMRTTYLNFESFSTKCDEQLPIKSVQKYKKEIIKSFTENIIEDYTLQVIVKLSETERRA